MKIWLKKAFYSYWYSRTLRQHIPYTLHPTPDSTQPSTTARLNPSTLTPWPTHHPYFNIWLHHTAVTKLVGILPGFQQQFSDRNSTHHPTSVLFFVVPTSTWSIQWRRSIALQDLVLQNLPFYLSLNSFMLINLFTHPNSSLNETH